MPKIEAAPILEHIKVLVVRRVRRPRAGTKGEELSVKYIEEQFKQLGLKPGNPDGTYVQKVPLVGITGSESAAADVHEGRRRSRRSSGRTTSWRGRSTWRDAASIDNSDVVFAGYGVEAPEFNWNDFKDVDVKGKTIVVLVNDPAVPDPGRPVEARPEVVQRQRDDLLRPLDLQVRGGRAQGRGGASSSSTRPVPAGYPFSVVQGNLQREVRPRHARQEHERAPASRAGSRPTRRRSSSRWAGRISTR